MIWVKEVQEKKCLFRVKIIWTSLYLCQWPFNYVSREMNVSMGLWCLRSGQNLETANAKWVKFTQSVLSGSSFFSQKFKSFSQDILKLLILNVQTCGCTMVKLVHDACQQGIKINKFIWHSTLKVFNLNPKQDIIFVGLSTIY